MSSHKYSAIRSSNTIKEGQCTPLTVPLISNIKTHEDQKDQVGSLSYRLFISSAGETTAHQFSQQIDERLTNISKIRFISCVIKYTEPATDALLHESLFVKLKNFPSKNFNVSARTTSDFQYHMFIPTSDFVVSGNVVKSYTLFPYDYKISVGRRVNVKDINVEVYYQDDTTGEFHLFTDLDFISFEMELLS